jgi:thiol-disulfide isomerase/thioredoxin
MFRQYLLALVLAMPFTVRAAAAEPVIYYFGATGCEFCANGLAYLERLQTKDKRVQLKHYDIVAQPDDATLFVRVVGAIGIDLVRVPMTIVGNHVIIGFEDDGTTGEEIRLTLDQCRVSNCPDLVLPITKFGPEIVSGSKEKWQIENRFAKATSAP